MTTAASTAVHWEAALQLQVVPQCYCCALGGGAIHGRRVSMAGASLLEAAVYSVASAATLT